MCSCVTSVNWRMNEQERNVNLLGAVQVKNRLQDKEKRNNGAEEEDQSLMWTILISLRHV